MTTLIVNHLILFPGSGNETINHQVVLKSPPPPPPPHTKLLTGVIIIGLICSEVYYISGCTHEYDINVHAGVHMSMCACMCAHLSMCACTLIFITTIDLFCVQTLISL